MATSLDGIAWPVLTKRLAIRRAVEADLEPTWEFRRDERVTRWMTAAPSTIEAYRERFADPDRLVRTLVVELDAVVIGDLMLAVEDGWAQAEVIDQAREVQAELGWCIAPEHQGRGYAAEAVEALLRICFEDLGLRRVTAHSFADNEASWRLMEKVGMRREIHTLRESLHRSGEWLDGIGYALLADEWRVRSLRR
ncbi:MAG TPA: GNAT family N-acetyltransferase [Nocardioidaceae bacterium]|nr:GNAT family N-acetyltransferase [Nocardioidaceae bacterium]